MLRIIDARDAGRGVEPARDLPPEAVEGARAILARVRADGDRALVELTLEHDGADVADGLRVGPEEVARAEEDLDPGLRRALHRMAERLRDLHGRQLPASWADERDGVRFGEVVRPLASVGCYAPGGRAAYPSTVLMTAIPARVAGVPRVVLCSPPGPDGAVAATVLAAAAVAGVDEVYRLGGAQAVAAMAFGTPQVRAVDKIVGPGNVWVTAAKREVAGVVGIDGLAGPSELAIVADGAADPALLAADLVAQAEHDPLARTVLVALDGSLPDRVDDALGAEVERSPRRDVVRRAVERSEAVVAPDEETAVRVVDRLAPEHVQLCVADPGAMLERLRSFGAAFLGSGTPVPFGDYGVGSNHVLPTMGTARFASGLRAADFVTVASFVEASASALGALGPEVELVAAAEGLPGHARAVAMRREGRP
ncbi:MAG TPA: histidinol dehydrogenase [Actinomycetota bacterium]|nr:histidinol dehydrogenase [Actinomycetota bacterium]